jgi:hypothetical protein
LKGGYLKIGMTTNNEESCMTSPERIANPTMTWMEMNMMIMGHYSVSYGVLFSLRFWHLNTCADASRIPQQRLAIRSFVPFEMGPDRAAGPQQLDGGCGAHSSICAIAHRAASSSNSSAFFRSPLFFFRSLSDDLSVLLSVLSVCAVRAAIPNTFSTTPQHHSLWNVGQRR